jgi:membrane associated rhomboid family serine protease
VNILARTIRGLIGLFIDDGKLALIVIGVLVLVGLLTHLGSLDGSIAMSLLVAGTIGALLANVIRTASTSKR